MIKNSFGTVLLFCLMCAFAGFATPPKSNQSTVRASVRQPKDTVVKAAQQQRMTFDFKDTDIRDIVRSISIAYGLNIIIDKDIATKVTIHLTDVPVLDGLRTILTAHGLELTGEKDIYRVVNAEKHGTAAIGLSKRDTLNLDIDNLDIRECIRDISQKTGLNIIAEKGVEGKISGSLRNINVENGIKALFEANGYVIRYRGDIIIVGAKEQAGSSGGSTAGGGRYMPGGMGYSQGGRGASQLDVRVKDGKVSIDLNNADLGDALRQIAEQSQLNFITYGDVRGEVTAKLDKVPLEKALSLLIAGTNYAFSIRDSILLVGDRNSATPAGQALSTSALCHLKHVKADNFMAILPKSIPMSNVQLVKEQNAVLVTGTMDLINQIKDFIEQVDIPTPQIMLEAIVVEFQRNDGSDWGIDAYEGKKSDSLSVSYIPGLSLPFSGKWFNKTLPKTSDGKKFDLGFGSIGILPDDFLLRIHALETRKKAKVMAQPRIATLNGNKASINVGTTSYFKLQGGTIENPLVRFQEIKSGIKLDITPWISQSGQVTVELSPEISNSAGSNSEGYPDVSTRSVNTTIQLNDGETIILGGLIQASSSTSTDRVPILGSIPILGKLFRSETTQKGSSELVIYLTPHILTRSDAVNLKSELDNFRNRMNSDKDQLDLDKK
jgi:type IV pilus assembly protein PilQ